LFAKHTKNIFWLTIIVLLDLMIVNGAFILAYLLRFKFEFLVIQRVDTAPIEAYLHALLFISVIWGGLLNIFGLYDFRRTRSNIDNINGIIKAVSFGTIITVAMTFFYRDFSYSRQVCLYSWLLSIVSLSLFRSCLREFGNLLRKKGYLAKTVMILGSGHMADLLARKIKQMPEIGYQVGLVDDIPTPPNPESSDIPAPSGTPPAAFQAFLARISTSKPDIILATNTEIPHYQLLEIISLAEEEDISLMMVPQIYDLLINYQDVSSLDGIPLVSLREAPSNTGSQLIKRLFDLTMALIGLMCLAPLLILIAILIKTDSAGPVFFIQKRVGRAGRPFPMYKFRTMVVDAEQRLAGMLDLSKLREPVFKFEQDDRITRFGAILRKTSLDELPQLINVFLGQMSLVGPRPEERLLVDQYNIWQRRRLKVTPGITGLQQVMCRGVPDLAERVRYDIYYIRKQSFLLDIYILFKTIFVVFSGKGAR
jgi:exopolysaccharide biosynthesis polyprenyl glycosylphosphotransferase